MHFRYARHTSKLEEIKQFYTSILNLKILGHFENHNGYNGIFVGNENSNWHLEFTCSKEAPIHSSDPDDALVLYPTHAKHYNTIMDNILNANVHILLSKNPYWNKNGVMISDPDGYQVIISSLKVTDQENIKNHLV